MAAIIVSTGTRSRISCSLLATSAGAWKYNVGDAERPLRMSFYGVLQEGRYSRSDPE